MKEFIETIKEGARAIRERQHFSDELSEKLQCLFDDVRITDKMVFDAKEAHACLLKYNDAYVKVLNVLSNNIHFSSDNFNWYAKSDRVFISSILGGILFPSVSMLCCILEVLEITKCIPLRRIRFAILMCTLMCDMVIDHAMRRLNDRPLFKVKHDVLELNTISRKKNVPAEILEKMLKNRVERLIMGEYEDDLPVVSAWCLMVNDLYDSKEDLCMDGDGDYPELFSTVKVIALEQCQPALFEYKLQKQTTEDLLEADTKTKDLIPVPSYLPFYSALFNLICSDTSPFGNVFLQGWIIMFNYGHLRYSALTETSFYRIRNFINRNLYILERFARYSTLCV